ncbi:MAG: hypothetical protein ACC657_02525 [Thiohalomonadales bacterium]
MSSKQDLIKEMIAMQKKFIDYEHKDGVDMKDYYKPESGHVLDQYREKYSELAEKVNAMAHEEKGSEA